MSELYNNIVNYFSGVKESFFGINKNKYDDESRCSSLKIEYPNTAALGSLNLIKNGPEHNLQYTNNRQKINKIPKKLGEYRLRDFYIKTSYNCAAVGSFKKDFVDICAIENGIKQGCRCLDFEIYSLKGKPVIGTSSVETNYIKESRNYIPFFKAMEVVASKSFNSPAPNQFDPMILHFRIKSENVKIFNQIAEDIKKAFPQYMLLHKKYGKEYKDKNLGDVKLKNLQKKIIICVDKTNTLFEETDLDKLVNICSNSIFMRLLKSNDVTYVQDFKELIEFNKGAMTFVAPDLTTDNTNVNPTIPLKYGCQLVAMNLQNNDENMKYYTKFFNDYGTSLVLKEKKLRKIDKLIPLPPLQDPKLSYRDRQVEDQHYMFRI